ncbi:transmembrane protease serine 9-like isoform X1 [Styela clava]
MEANIWMLSTMFLGVVLPRLTIQQTTVSTEGLTPACSSEGLDVTGTRGTIMSPNYPENYPNALNCKWRISTANGTRIAVKFEPFFEIEPDGTGCYDYIEFSEDTGYESIFCGFEPHPSWTSESNSLGVTFFTDVFVTFAGFSFNWTAVDKADVTKANTTTIVANSGTISSLNYPDNYNNLWEEAWIVDVEIGKFILIEFDTIYGIEKGTGTTCPFDSLTFSEGVEPPSPWTFKIVICSDENHGKLLIKDDGMYVVFKSDVDVTGSGFSFNFSAIDPPTCAETNYLTGTSGTVSTPMYPLPYERDLNCSWFITTPENTQVAIKFSLDFNIEDTDTCFGDYLEIYDGPSTQSEKYLDRRFCGPYPPKGFLSTTNQVTIKFFSSPNVFGDDNFMGFSLNWTAEEICKTGDFHCWDGTCINETKKCNGVVDCPVDNADEVECKLESVSKCGVSDIAPEFRWDPRIVGGHDAVPGSWPWQGRLLYYRLDKWEFTCGTVLIADRWALTATHCVDKGFDALVVFGNYNTSEYNEKTAQNVTVENIFAKPGFNWKDENGWSEGKDISLLLLSSPVNFTVYVKPICLPTMFPSTGTYIVITGWGRTYVGAPGSDVLKQASLPIFPQDKCLKPIIEGGVTADDIFCVGFPTGGVSTCSGDSGGPVAHLNNGKWEVIGLASFGLRCGTVPGNPSAYVNVSAHLTFINNLLETKNPRPVLQSFVIKDQTNGTLMSPNYPSNYPANTYVRWYIIGPENTRISVRFDPKFDIEGVFNDVSPLCSADYLIIYDGADTGSLTYRYQKNCGTRAPPNFESNSNSIIAEFWSDGAFEAAGFSFNWTTNDDCEITEERCHNKTCIPISKKCDGKYDCDDKEDEFECVLGNPTTTECGKPAISPSFPWNPLVIGGHDVIQGSWPWQIGLFRLTETGWRFTCGGTLISEYWVLSAAHCLSFSEIYQVAIGAHNFDEFNKHEKRLNVSFVLPHPEYFSTNDIGFVRLEEPVDFTSEWYKPACLPESNDNNLPPVGSLCVITGWGVIGGTRQENIPSTMQQSFVYVLNGSVCKEDFYLGLPEETPLDAYICLGDLDQRTGACYGDSGGPLVCHVGGVWRQYGITSWGISCGQRSFYERISNSLDLINDVLNLEVCKDFEVREGTRGTVTIPQFFGEYIMDLDCTWLLRAPSDKLIVIRFTFFDVEDCSFAEYDYLKIYDGNTTDARMVRDETLCGQDRSLRGFESSTNEVLISFTSDNVLQYKGFEITWETVDNCGSNEFRCWNGSCINGDLKCNKVNNCEDKSDEIECPHYGQECGQQTIVPEFLWAPRVVGGMIAVEGSWPWQVLVSNEYEQILCGGSIIHENWVLTSAECVADKSAFEVIVAVGQYDLSMLDRSRLHAVTQIFLYDPFKTSQHDIALLKLDRSITFQKNVQPICINLENTLVTGETCVVTGWGVTYDSTSLDSSQLLRQTRIPIANPEFCQKITHNVEFNGDTMFCAGDLSGGSDACSNDVGGPLVCFRNNVWKQFGIVTSNLGCGISRLPSFYTKVSYYKEWIEATIGDKLPIPTPPTTEATTTEEITTDKINQTASMTSISSSTTSEIFTAEGTPPQNGTSAMNASETTATTKLMTTSSAAKIHSIIDLIFALLLCQSIPQ